MKIQIEIDVKSLKKDFFGRVREYARYRGCSHNTIADRLSGKIKIHFEDLNEMSEFLGRDPRDYIKVVYSPHSKLKRVRDTGGSEFDEVPTFEKTDQGADSLSQSRVEHISRKA